jgi:hypothetical protein
LSATGRITALIGALATIAGTAVLAIGRSSAADITGAALLGLAGIMFTGLAFLLVGESEDRDRAHRPDG